MEDDDIYRLFPNEPSNIGVVLGKASGNLVDVHFVDDDALRLANKFMSETEARFGPLSRPNSHWLYVPTYDDDTSLTLGPRKWSTSKIGTIVELRGEGQYSVFPGSAFSRDKVADPIKWEAGDRYPHSIVAKGLLGDITCVAIATILLKQWNGACCKSLVFAAAKFMQAYRFEKFTAKHIIQGLAKTAGESEDAIKNYLGLVESVFECAKDVGRFELVNCLGEELSGKPCDVGRNDTCWPSNLVSAVRAAMEALEAAPQCGCSSRCSTPGGSSVWHGVWTDPLKEECTTGRSADLSIDWLLGSVDVELPKRCPGAGSLSRLPELDQRILIVIPSSY